MERDKGRERDEEMLKWMSARPATCEITFWPEFEFWSNVQPCLWWSSFYHTDKKTQQSLIQCANLVPETAVPPRELDASQTSVRSHIHSFFLCDTLSHTYDMDVGCYNLSVCVYVWVEKPRSAQSHDRGFYFFILFIFDWTIACATQNETSCAFYRYASCVRQSPQFFLFVLFFFFSISFLLWANTFLISSKPFQWRQMRLFFLVSFSFLTDLKQTGLSLKRSPQLWTFVLPLSTHWLFMS